MQFCYFFKLCYGLLSFYSTPSFTSSISQAWNLLPMLNTEVDLAIQDFDQTAQIHFSSQPFDSIFVLPKRVFAYAC